MAEYDLGTARGRIVLDTTGARTGARQAQRSMSGLRGQAQRTGQQFKAAGRTMTKTGASLSKKVTAPIVGLGVATVATAADFESSMNKVKAVSGATEGQMAKMEEQARELGSTTQFSASEAAEGMSFLSMAGFEAEETISAMPGVLDLAAAGQMDLARTADIASNVLTGFGLEAEETGRVTDVMAETASSANTDMNQLGDAMSYVAPVANSSGMAIEETSAAIGALSDAGIQGSRAGTSLRQIIARLESPSKKAAKKIEELGIVTHDTSGNLMPMASIVDQLGESGATTADIMDMFGARAGPSMAAMIDQGADSLREQEEALKNSQGRAKEMAETQMEGLSGALKELKSALQEVALTIADTGLLDQMTDIAKGLTNWFRKLGEVSPQLIKIGVIIAGVAAAIGPLLVVLGLMVSSIGSLIGALGAVTIPMLAIPAAIAAIVAGFVLAYNRSETFREALRKLGGMVADVFGRIKSWIADLVAAFRGDFNEAPHALGSLAESAKTMGLALRQAFTTAKEILSTIGTWISKFVKALTGDLNQAPHAMGRVSSSAQQMAEIVRAAIDVIKGAINLFVTVVGALWRTWGNTIIRLFREVWNAVKTIIGGALDVVQGIFETFAGLLTGDWSRMWNGIKQILSGVITIIHGIIDAWFAQIRALFSVAKKLITSVWSDLWGALKRTASSAIDAVVGWVKDLPGRAKRALSSAWNAYKAFWVTVFTALKDFVSDRIDDVIGFFSALPGDLKRVLSSAWNSYKNWWRNSFQAAQDFVSDRIDDIIQFFSDLPGDLLRVLKAAWGEWSDFWTNVFTNIKDFVLDRIKDIIADVKSLPGRAKSALESTWNTFKSHWDSVFNSAKDFVSNTLSTLVDYVKNFPGRIKTGLENAWDKFRRYWDAAFSAIRDFVSTEIIDTIVDYITNFPGRIKNGLENAWGKFRRLWDSSFNGVKNFAHTTVENIVNFFKDLPTRLADAAEKIGDTVKVKITGGIERLKTYFADTVNDIIGFFASIPEKVADVLRGLGDKIAGLVGIDLNLSADANTGDGPGAPVPRSAGGSALSRVQAAMEQVPGTYITSTYRTPAENRAAGGSPTSYHLDTENPAVDIGAASAGPLDQLAAILRQMGPWREFLWRVPNHAPGDNMHVHVAHGGGVMGGIGSREMMALLERGEGVISADAMQNIEAAMGRRSIPSLSPDAMFEQMEFNQHNYGLTSEDDVKRATKRGLRQMAAEWEFS